MPRKARANYRQVQGLLRGLNVLAALNGSPGGAATAVRLGAQVGLHRTTAKRLLETLEGAGFVAFSPENQAYSLTWRVRRLSDGFRQDTDVVRVAAPLMRALTQKIVWPCNLATLDGDEMVIRESTHAVSRLSFHSSMLGRRLPLLETGLGRAYLAHCPKEERDLLLAMVGKGRDVSRMLESVLARGYAVYEGEWLSAGRFGTLAVPIEGVGRVIACLNFVFARKALSTAEAARRHIGDLQATAKAIERQLSQLVEKGATQ
jgi:IclR family transcriptional regulator, mhp operon transcriptional activator